MRYGEILGRERRRRWSDDEKLSILQRVGLNGRTVADVAREEDLTRQHIYQWRQEMRRKGLWPEAGLALFLPVEALQDDPPMTTAAASAMIEISLRNGRQLRCPRDLADRDLTRLIHILEAA